MRRSGKMSVGTSFIDFMYKKSLKTLVLPFIYIKIFAAVLLAYWIAGVLIDLVGGATYFAQTASIRTSAPNEHAQSDIKTAPTSVRDICYYYTYI